MKGFFHYDLKSESAEGGEEKLCSFLFKPTGYVAAEALAEGIELAGIAAPFPDVIVIQCMNHEYKRITDLAKGAVVGQAIRRISKRSQVFLASYDNEGRVKDIGPVGTAAGESLEWLRDYLRKDHQHVLQAGLEKLFAHTGVIQIAPSGYTFVKPSGDRSRLFLKTEEALSDSERVHFVAFSILPRLAARQTLLKTPVNSIFVDTMGIASVAYALRDLHWADTSGDQHIPRIESFHSHGGLENFDAPLNGTAFCLISTSQSMRLQKLWKEKTRATDDEVVTLLSVKYAENSQLALFAVDITKGEIALSDANALHDIRIVGERFYPDQIKPRKVLLRNKVHAVQELYELTKQWHTLDIFKLQVRKANVVRPLFFDILPILEKKNGEFSEWIDRICEQYVPLSIQAVVTQDDEPSIRLASEIIKRLKKKYNINLLRDTPVNESEILEGNYEPDQDRALLIVSAVIGKGTRLLSISRDLRDKHLGARCYVIGFQVAETQSQITTLKQNLKSPASKSRWDIVTYTAIAIGKGLGHSFETEMRLGIYHELINERGKKISGSNEGLTDDAFLPSSAGLCPMELRKDFAYWPEIQYVPNGRYAPWVFAIVSSLLQKAREDATLSSECRLSTEAYQNVVLDPENFLRYNDGIIQSAILRVAHPHELDYSCSSELSNTVKEILIKFFASVTKCQGEAAFEFALALRTGRLKLQKEHYEQLEAFLKSRDNSASAQVGLLNAILGIDKGVDNLTAQVL
jgi:hypothetical protein